MVGNICFYTAYVVTFTGPHVLGSELYVLTRYSDSGINHLLFQTNTNKIRANRFVFYLAL